MTNIDNAHDEEPLAWCPGCGDRIPTEVIRERGVCSNCYGTSDDPWATQQALAEAWAEGHRTGWENCQDGNYGDDYRSEERRVGKERRSRRAGEQEKKECSRDGRRSAEQTARAAG